MPVALFQKQKVHFQVEGDHGAWIMLYPPLGESIQNWYRQSFVKSLAKSYRLILIDPLGQGLSDCPDEPYFYTLAHRSKQIVEVLRELRVTHAYFVGLGLGSQTGFALADRLPKILRSLIIMKSHPYPITIGAPEIQNLAERIQKKGSQAYCQYLSKGTSLDKAREQDILQIPPHALIHALQALCQWQGLSVPLEEFQSSGMFIIGRNEEQFATIRDASNRMPKFRYQILSHLEFVQGWPDHHVLVPELTNFFERRRTSRIEPVDEP